MALTPEQTQELQIAIEQRLAVLRTEVSRDLGRLREDRQADLAGASPDPGDESVASVLSDLDQAEAARDLAELRMLDAARQRIAEGSYGSCIDCARDIGFERLRVNPGAERCIHCQTLYEKTHASPGASSL